ncbi:hypothetical protein GSI_01977 [Ganoderma sinense ZZ0214-1]|uniref:Uncharacterized protein n=1 Tax=Ganoderma sinense ZZ0214-1 TaxID=1077348 RepID=A0A2G8SNA8_9APHY|nr:hypothetical protein GSI_01977 [Ganoderma sinense ZZ0214-1]
MAVACPARTVPSTEHKLLARTDPVPPYVPFLAYQRPPITIPSPPGCPFPAKPSVRLTHSRPLSVICHPSPPPLVFRRVPCLRSRKRSPLGHPCAQAWQTSGTQSKFPKPFPYQRPCISKSPSQARLRIRRVALRAAALAYLGRPTADETIRKLGYGKPS